MKQFNRTLSQILVLSLILFLQNCQKDQNNSATTLQNVIGYVQKGPFINGSSVTAYDLQTNLVPTGKSFIAQITDNKGAFLLNDISLSSNFVSLKADGFYFNEISGQQSAAQITLYALSDVTGKTDINVNLLTHLEKSRVETLIKSGKSFSESKTQAQKEILAIFNIEKKDIKDSENLNLAEIGDDNGILLAISSVLQAFRSESELTELLSNISEDISSDGVLSNDALGSALINQAVYLDTVSIKRNLAQRYTAIGSQSQIPNFGKYITNFKAKTQFKITNPVISYPAQGSIGPNILSVSDSVFTRNSTSLNCDLIADVPKFASLKIKITSIASNEVAPGDSSNTVYTYHPLWGYLMGSSNYWTISDFDQNNFNQIFTAQAGQTCDVKMMFDPGSFLIEYYEMNSIIPTRMKTIKVK